ncbi:MAG: hypothetical protein AAGM22_28895 [Acidobacteriota bacterium]
MKQLMALVLLAFSVPAWGQIPFQTGFTARGLNGFIFDFAEFDDGDGTALYAAGRFGAADDQKVELIAKWDGARWESLIPGLQASGQREINSVQVHDDGSGEALYAGGRFEAIGGVLARYVARWDGTSWSEVGAGLDVWVRSLAVYDGGSGPELFAGDEDGRVHRWDGQAWTEILAQPLDGRILGLAVFDQGGSDRLAIGFARTGSVMGGGVYVWDGTTAAPLETAGGVGVNGPVQVVFTGEIGDGPQLFVAGNFELAGNEEELVAWDGTQWKTGFGDTPQDVIRTLAVLPSPGGPQLVVSGVPGIVSVWDGSGFVRLQSDTGGIPGISGVLNSNVFALTTYDDGQGPELFAGGAFWQDGLSNLSRVSRWDGSSWQEVSAGGEGCGNIGDSILDAGFFDVDGQVDFYAVGDFETIGGTMSRGIALFENGSWSPLRDPAGSLISSRIQALESFTVGGVRQLIALGASRLAEPSMLGLGAWDGSSWAPLDKPPIFENSSFLSRLETLLAADLGAGERLFVAGEFGDVDGQIVNNILQWDGVDAAPLMGLSGAGVNGLAAALAVFDDGNGPALYVGGDFTEAGGVPAQYLAKWDGTDWSAVGVDSLDGPVDALEVFDAGSGPELYIGGEFTQVGTTEVNHVVRWTGGAFLPLAGPSGTGLELVPGVSPRFAVSSLSAGDAGDGTKLYVGGSFDHAGGELAEQFATWDGTGWAPAASGAFMAGSARVGPNVVADFTTGMDPALFVGGGFRGIGGVEFRCVTIFRAPRPEIFADGFESGDTNPWTATFP